MYKLIYLILFPIYLVSATMHVNIMRDNNETYSIVHIQDTDKIVCKEGMDVNFKNFLECHFKKNLIRKNEPLENRYFKINISGKDIKIVPKFDYAFYPFKKTFVMDSIVEVDREKAYKHWVVVGFKNSSDLFLKRDSTLGLQFPIKFTHKQVPIIGELDFDLNPINQSKNATAILKIKEAYNNRKYQKVLTECDYLLGEEKNIFLSEVKLYKIRALDKIVNAADSKGEDDGLDPMEVITLTKEWIAENPSSEILPEMYMLLAKTYLKLGRASKAKEYLDILQREYHDSRYNYLAQLVEADKIYKVKSKDEAIKKYKNILYNTSDFDIASMAALRLSEAYLAKKEPKKAAKYIVKVMKANRKFIKEHPVDSYRLAKVFSENNESNISVGIATLLQNDEQESLVNQDELKKNIAYWYEKSGEIEKAINLYKAYLEEEKYGKYRAFVLERLDKIMLHSNESNVTKKLASLDTIMIKYKNDAIYAKALQAKAQILLEQKAYEKILALGGELKKYGGEGLLKEVAKKQLKIYYHDRVCDKASNLLREYNLTIEPAEEEVAFDCFEKENAYEKALEISRKNLQKEDIEEKLKWTYKSAKIYKKIGRYKALILAADDIEKLEKIAKTNKYDDIIYDKIDAYYRLGGYDTLMLREVQKCEKRFPNNIKNLDVYEKVLLYAKKRNDTALVIHYTKKMIALQEKYNIETYTPKIELDYIEALRERKSYKKALEVDIKLLYKKLNDKQRAHVLYLAGYLSEKLEKKSEAKEFYTKCGEIVEDSAWIELCSDNLALLEDK